MAKIQRRSLRMQERIVYVIHWVFLDILLTAIPNAEETTQYPIKKQAHFFHCEENS